MLQSPRASLELVSAGIYVLIMVTECVKEPTVYLTSTVAPLLRATQFSFFPLLRRIAEAAEDAEVCAAARLPATPPPPRRRCTAHPRFSSPPPLAL